MKKSKIMFIIVLFIVFLNSIVNASELKVVNTNSDYSIKNDNIKFTKKIVDYDKEQQEVEIELCIENTKKTEEKKENAEIIILLDNSSSMKNVENSTTRKNTTYKATNKLINSIYNNIDAVKVGIIQYSVSNQILTELTNSKESALNALEKYKNAPYGKSTGTDKALELAKSKFSNDCKNKIVLLITDGYPGNGDATKSALKELDNANISVLSLIVCNKNNIKSIQEVFGTEQKPTAGKVYYIATDSEIDKILNELMYTQIINYIEYPVKNIQIKDIFPKDILEYFDIEYVGTPSKGNVSNMNIDSFIWNINELKEKEKAIFNYKIKIKNNVNISKIIGKEIETNLGVIVKYQDKTSTEVEEIVKKNPVIKIEEDIYISSIVEEVDKDKISTEKVVENTADKNKVTTEEVIENTVDENKITEDVKENDVEQKEFRVVDLTPKEEKQTVPQTKVSNKTKYDEKLPQTGDTLTTFIVISIIITILFAIKMKLSVKDIHIVRK